MFFPNPSKEREPINLRHGIKSSLGDLQELFALVFTLYLTEKDASINYSKEVSEAQIIHIEVADQTFTNLLDFFQLSVNEQESFREAINDNPLFKGQLESLQVALELFWRLGKITFVNQSLSGSRERTGGQRFEKKINFSLNMEILRLALVEDNGSISDNLKKLLKHWILKTRDFNADLALFDRIKRFLTLFSEETQFKIRKSDGQEVLFHQEGIYTKLLEEEYVHDKDHRERVGPFRILNSFIAKDLHSYLTKNAQGYVLREAIEESELQKYSQLVEVSLDLTSRKTVVYEQENEENEVTNNNSFEVNENLPLPYQKIFFGSPGTGKSKKVNDLTNNFDVTRVTFHPEMDYQSFIGSYKPIMDGDKIKYGFVPQAFLKAYCSAWLKPEKPHILIIEEINRGNCAQIFGDLFQSLDRDIDGSSKYPINCEQDVAEYLKSFFEAHDKDVAERYQVLSGNGAYDVISLPKNLYLLATMNTSDQSLFPMDSAFKRRWEWEYVPIDYDDAKSFEIHIGNNKYCWGVFIEKINPKIKELTGSEDKQLGNRFVNPNDKVITEDQFKAKIIFYLWSEVYKDEFASSDSIFRYEDADKNIIDIQFGDFYTSSGTEIIKDFLKFNEIEPIE